MATKKRPSLKDNNPLVSNKRARSSRTKRDNDAVVKEVPKQTTFLIYKDQLEWLETVCFNASKKGGKKMSKAYILRSLIDAAKEKGLDLEGVKNEAEVKSRVLALFTE